LVSHISDRRHMDPLNMPGRISVRVRADDRELLELAARRERMRLSEFVRKAVLQAAANAVATSGSPKAA
jgi:uncharacterized protein (DUF1778 family)